MWRHTPHRAATKGPGMFTGMVDLTRDQDGRVHARLLDLASGAHRQGVRDLADGPHGRLAGAG